MSDDTLLGWIHSQLDDDGCEDPNAGAKLLFDRVKAIFDILKVKTQAVVVYGSPLERLSLSLIYNLGKGNLIVVSSPEENDFYVSDTRTKFRVSVSLDSPDVPSKIKNALIDHVAVKSRCSRFDERWRSCAYAGGKHCACRESVDSLSVE